LPNFIARKRQVMAPSQMNEQPRTGCPQPVRMDGSVFRTLAAQVIYLTHAYTAAATKYIDL
jgi:hypothetical protein